jgi:hypothetical protein
MLVVLIAERPQRARRDKRGFDLISDAMPFGRQGCS